MFTVIFIQTFIFCTVWPYLLTITILFSVSPIALVSVSLISFFEGSLLVDSIPVSFSSVPLALESISVDFYEFSLPMRLTVLPFSVVYCPIRPCLFAFSIFELTYPFSFIYYACIFADILSSKFTAHLSSRTAFIRST